MLLSLTIKSRFYCPFSALIRSELISSDQLIMTQVILESNLKRLSLKIRLSFAEFSRFFSFTSEA